MSNHGEGCSSSNLGQTQSHPHSTLGCFLSQHRLGIAWTLNKDKKYLYVAKTRRQNLLLIQIVNQLTNAVSSELEGFRMPKQAQMKGNIVKVV